MGAYHPKGANMVRKVRTESTGRPEIGPQGAATALAGSMTPKEGKDALNARITALEGAMTALLKIAAARWGEAATVKFP